MKTLLRLTTFGLLSLFIHLQACAQTEDALFTSSTSSLLLNRSKSFPVKVISFQGNVSNNKVLMQWVISENETADQFEVERSFDGKNFTTVGLVFGTDKAQTETYMFYEKNISKKASYRIKCIDKKQTVVYSDVIAIDPAGNQNF